MTNPSTKCLVAAAAVIAGALQLAGLPEAQARGANTKPSASSAGGYTPKPVIRDHRKNPQQWTLPPHYHRHDRR
jgi:hypothetical protein